MKHKRVLAAVAAVVAVTFWLTPPASAEGGTVTGMITAKGLRSSGDIVVSLQAPGLKVMVPDNKPEMDQKGMTFIPHVMPVVKGTTVKFLNSDPYAHNVFSPEGKYNLGTWPTGQTRDHKFDKAGVYTQLCRVHPEMEAFIVVLDTPYFAVTDKEGKYTIKSVPAGNYTLVAWSEKLKESKQAVTVENGKTVTVDLTLKK
jgi:plastocyanin